MGGGAKDKSKGLRGGRGKRGGRGSLSSQLLKGLQRVRASVESAIGSFGGGEDSDEAGGSSSDGGSGSDEEGEWCLPWGEGKRSTEGEGAGQAVAAPSKQQVVLVEVDRRLTRQIGRAHV